MRDNPAETLVDMEDSSWSLKGVQLVRAFKRFKFVKLDLLFEMDVESMNELFEGMKRSPSARDYISYCISMLQLNVVKYFGRIVYLRGYDNLDKG